MRPLNPPHVLLFGVVLAVVLFAALFPFLPGQLDVGEGDVASQDIRSPRDETFESALLTEQARESAAQAVPEVLVFNPEVRADQLATLGANIALVTQVRNDEVLSDAAKRARLVGVLSRPVADIALSLEDARWERVADEAENALDAALSESVAPDGQQAARDQLAQRISLELFSSEAEVVADLAGSLIIPTLVADPEATEQAREAARLNVEPVQQTITKGQLILEAGQPVDATAVEVLDQVGLLSPRVEWDDVVAVGVVCLVAAVVVAMYIRVYPSGALRSQRRLALLIMIVSLPVFLGKVYFSLVLPDDDSFFLAYFLPLAAAPMFIAALLETRLAIVVGLLQAALLMFAVVSLPDLALVETVAPVEAVRIFLVYGLGAVVGIFAVHRVQRVNQYAFAGVLVAATSFALLLATWLLEPEREAIDLAWMTAAAGVGGLASGLITAGGYSAVGSLLGVTTRLQLMELAQLNAPLLRRLQDEAPGTFHHSIIVGNLAERAADLVGADALLVRVGCYYHDIGKVLQPGFYIENQMGGMNPHDGMDPRASARVIAEHVRGGVELADREGLPRRVRDFIPEHHGTRLIPYFYRIASQRDPNVDESLFRYPGPRPQTSETAIVMLADSTEAMVRASDDRSAERIDAIVDEVIAERLAEGELEECDLTFRDIRTVAESFKQTLRGVYHPRIAYPEPSERERTTVMGLFRPGRRSPPSPAAPSESSPAPPPSR